MVMILELKLLNLKKFIFAVGFSSHGAARSAVQDSEMSIRAAAAKLLQNGRILLRAVRQNQNKSEIVDGFGINILSKGGAERAVESSPNAFGRGSSAVRNVGYQFHQHARRLFVDNVLRRVTNFLSADLRERAAKRLLFGDSAPFFALVGVSLASGSGILTKDDELEGVCWEIREAVSKLQKSQYVWDNERAMGLADLDVGPPIAKGCSAVVYAARLKSEGAVGDGGDRDTDFSRLSFPLALKMMFNYDAESNAGAVLRAMYRETVPAPRHLLRNLETELELDAQDSTQHLPPHPNIVEVVGVFADRIPCLPGSLELYPDALPARINPGGSGRNMSLFLLMNRYDCSLKRYLGERRPSVREATLLLAQLLEATTHMARHGVAHRDLKSDNILLWMAGEEECPLLAVTDFGCCLAGGLNLPYHTPDTDRGGNTALMAPEVACAVAGPFSSISYGKSDAWTCGALAYELFCSGYNPFYGGSQPPLRSRSYSESQLPALPVDVPPVVASVVAGLLVRSPAKRLSAEMAATVLQLHLWAPSSWLTADHSPSSNEMLQWLLCLTTKVLCEGGGGRRTLAEYRLISSLLTRVSLRQLKVALSWALQVS